MKTRIIEVTMKFWKTFNIEVPESVTELDVLECDMVEDEARPGGFSGVDLEHDETTSKDMGEKTPEEIQRLKRHEKVFTWKEASHES